MPGSMEERLRLVVEASTQGATTAFDQLGRSADDTAKKAKSAGDDVAAAADRSAQARLREQDAAGKLSVAEVRLQELRDSGRAKASQLEAAEQRVESARRGLQAASGASARAEEDYAQAMQHVGRAADEQVESVERSSHAQEKFREQVSDVKGAIVGLAAGYSVAEFGKEAFDSFLEGSRGAQSLATSMNATIEQGGQLSALFGSLGLEADDLLEIQAEFAQKVGQNKTALSQFGATVKTNADGTTNWALTIEDALVQLQKIPDATKRNQIGFSLFGEEGYKQLSRLLNTGMSVQEALDRIGTPFSEADVAATQAYDRAMQNFSLSVGGAGRALARELLPVVTGVVQGIGELADVIGEIPAPITLAVGAAVLLGLAQRSAAAEGGLLAGALAGVQGRALGFRSAVLEASAATGILGATAGTAKVAAGGLLSAVGGPLGATVIALGVGFELYNRFLGKNSAEAENAAQANQSLANALKESNGVVNDSVRKQAALSAQQSGLLDVAQKAGVAQGKVTDALLGNKSAYNEVQGALTRYIDAHRDSNGGGDIQFGKRLDDEGDAASRAKDNLGTLAGTVRDNTKEQQQLGAELGQTTDKAALAQAAMDTLTGSITAGTTNGAAFEAAVRAAADAQSAQSLASDTAKAAIDAYNATTRDAVDTTYDLINARYASEDANFAFQKSVDDVKAAHDDEKTSVNEVREAQVKLYEAALSASSAAADAAVNTAKSQGTILTTTAEAQIRADAMIGDLRSKLNTPGLTASAKAELQGIIDQLTTAKDNSDIQALITLTGVDQTKGQIDDTTKDRDTTVTVGSSGGPAVKAYLDGIAAQPRLATVNVESRGGPAVIAYLAGVAAADRLALVRVESRGGPAVLDYLRAIAVADRLALIRTESRGGPAVIGYLDGIAARDRLAIINVESRGGPAVDAYLNSLTRTRTATIQVRQQAIGAPVTPGAGPTGAPMGALRGAPALTALGGSSVVNLRSVSLDLELVGRADRSKLASAERGRATIADIRAAEKDGGAGWRNGR